MGLRTEITADHEDWPEISEASLCRSWIASASKCLAESEAAAALYPPGHQGRRRAVENAAHYQRIVAENTARLREIEETEHAA